MKKTLLSFTFAAGIAITLLSSCGKESTSTCNPDGFKGTFNGNHKVKIGLANLADLNIIEPIEDQIIGTVVGDSVNITSDLLPIALTGTINASNPNLVNLDSVILGLGDTIRIPSGVAPDSVLKIWDLRAGGTGTLDCNTINTSLKVKTGKTNLTIAFGTFNLSNLNNLGLELSGSFKRP